MSSGQGTVGRYSSCMGCCSVGQRWIAGRVVGQIRRPPNTLQGGSPFPNEREIPFLWPVWSLVGNHQVHIPALHRFWQRLM
jgi:hypothetical protein